MTRPAPGDGFRRGPRLRRRNQSRRLPGGEGLAGLAGRHHPSPPADHGQPPPAPPRLGRALRGNLGPGRGALGQASQFRVLRRPLHRPGRQHHPRRDRRPRPGRAGPDTDTAFLEVLKQLRNLTRFSTPLRKTMAKAILSSAEPRRPWTRAGSRSCRSPGAVQRDGFHIPVENHRPPCGGGRTHRDLRPDVFFPIEVRRIAADEAWLSPFQGAPRGSIAVHCHYKDDYAFCSS